MSRTVIGEQHSHGIMTARAEISCRVRFGQGTDSGVKRVIGHRRERICHVPCTKQPAKSKSPEMPNYGMNDRTRLLPATTGNKSHRVRVPGLCERLPEAARPLLSKGVKEMQQSIALAAFTPIKFGQGRA
eukprot:1716241-Heterocapsa_arctica.AAC.1